MLSGETYVLLKLKLTDETEQKSSQRCTGGLLSPVMHYTELYPMTESTLTLPRMPGRSLEADAGARSHRGTSSLRRRPSITLDWLLRLLVVQGMNCLPALLAPRSLNHEISSLWLCSRCILVPRRCIMLENYTGTTPFLYSYHPLHRNITTLPKFISTNGRNFGFLRSQMDDWSNINYARELENFEPVPGVDMSYAATRGLKARLLMDKSASLETARRARTLRPLLTTSAGQEHPPSPQGQLNF